MAHEVCYFVPYFLLILSCFPLWFYIFNLSFTIYFTLLIFCTSVCFLFFSFRIFHCVTLFCCYFEQPGLVWNLNILWFLLSIPSFDKGEVHEDLRDLDGSQLFSI